MSKAANTTMVKSILTAAVLFVMLVATVMPAFAKKDTTAIVHSVAARVCSELESPTQDKLVVQVADRAADAIR